MGIFVNIERRQNSLKRSPVVFHIKHCVRFAMDVGRDVIRFLWREAIGLILRHVVLHKRGHFGYLVHAGAVTV